MSTIGERIRKIRKLNELNQVEFSSMIGVSQGTLSELEQNRYKPAIDTLMQIRDRFDTDLLWLLYGENQLSTKDTYEKKFVENEIDLLLRFRKLKVNDQEEILEIIKLKINRYNS